MKQKVFFIAALFAAAFVWFGCKTAADGSTEISAPDIGSAGDLTKTGGTAPSSPAAAVTLFTDTATAIANFVATNKTQNAIPGATAADRTATQAQTIPYNLNYTTANGGTIVCKGSVATMATAPDAGWQASAGKTYNDLYTFEASGSVTGTITNAQITYGGVTYTINGKIKNDLSESYNLDYQMSASSAKISNATIDLDFSAGIGIGTAVAVKRSSDGVGAKFIISFAVNYSENNIPCTTDGLTKFQSELDSYLDTKTATLMVYDDNDKLVYATTITQRKAFGASLFGY